MTKEGCQNSKKFSFIQETARRLKNADFNYFNRISLERKKLEITQKSKELTYETFLKLCKKIDPNFWIRYCVYRDLRKRGYIVKTALKFGADFRVYDRGIKPGEDHAKWIVYPVHESTALTWYDFAAKNRVAHSTKKRLLIGIVDEESDVTYYEINWKRP